MSDKTDLVLKIRNMILESVDNSIQATNESIRNKLKAKAVERENKREALKKELFGASNPYGTKLSKKEKKAIRKARRNKK